MILVILNIMMWMSLGLFFMLPIGFNYLSMQYLAYVVTVYDCIVIFCLIIFCLTISVRYHLTANRNSRRLYMLVLSWARRNVVKAMAFVMFEIVLVSLLVLFAYTFCSYISGFAVGLTSCMSRHPWWVAFLLTMGFCAAGSLWFKVIEKAREHRHRCLASRKREHGCKIRNSVKDDLTRTPFVRSFLDRLCNLSARQTSYVAFYGKWGEGKTTVIDYLVNLSAKDKGGLVFVDFSPWECLRGEDFANQLFCAIAERLQEEDEDSKLQRKLRLFGARLSLVKFRGLLMTLPEFGSTLSYLFDLLLPLSSVKRSINELLHELKRRGRRIVVVIDDIDRIPPKEIFQIIRLIRTNGDLDYLTYLVVADEVYLSNAVRQMIDANADNPDCGYAYLEKIFPHIEKLPPLGAEVLPELFMQRVSQVATRHDFDPPNGNDKGMMCACSYLTTMRQVIMLSEEVDKYLEFLERVVRLGPNVDLEDLIALMAMKLFEKDFYEKLYLNRNKFMNWTAILSGLREEYTEEKLKELFAPKVSSIRWERIKIFLKECVGIGETTKSATDNSKVFVYDVNQDVALSNFRLSSIACFENYYTGFTASNVGIMRHELKEFRQASNNVDAMSQIFKAKASKNLLESFVHFLGDQQGFTWVMDGSNFLQALIRLSADIFDQLWTQNLDGRKGNVWSIFEVIWYCIVSFSRSFFTDKPENRSKAFLNVLTLEQKSIAILSRIVMMDSKNHFKDHDMPDALFTKDDLVSAQKMFCERVESLCRDRQMAGRPYELPIRSAWRHSCKALKGDWIGRMQNLITEESKWYPEVIGLIDSFRLQGYIADYEGELLPINLDELLSVCSGDLLVATLEANQEALNIKGKFFLKVLQEGVRRRKQNLILSADEQLKMRMEITQDRSDVTR